MMSCADCGENLDEVSPGQPCPTCGGTRRTAVVNARPIDTVAITESVSFVITKGDDRPWTEKWQLMLHHLAALERIYSGEGRHGNLEAESRATSFFVECDHLAEWLWQDVTLRPRLTERVVNDHVETHPSLVTAQDISNTHKHHTRRPEARAARIRKVGLGDQVRLTIELDWAGPNASTVDALELARQCVADWRGFLTNRGIDEP